MPKVIQGEVGSAPTSSVALGSPVACSASVGAPDRATGGDSRGG
jgi:hypothetical protein